MNIHNVNSFFKFLIYACFFALICVISSSYYNNTPNGMPAGNKRGTRQQSPAHDNNTTSIASDSPDESGSYGVNPYSDTKKIALTFDDGPHPATTPRLLDGLRERNVKATFFVVGKNADSNRDILKQMYEDGHLIGNHTNTHCNLSVLSCDSALEEIIAANNIIYDITGSYTEFVRPPFGECEKTLSTSLNMFKVMWNIDPRDWSVQNKKAVVNYVVSHVKDGDIILLHDIFDTSVDAALEIVDILSAEGYEFVTVDEIMFP